MLVMLSKHSGNPAQVGSLSWRDIRALFCINAGICIFAGNAPRKACLGQACSGRGWQRMGRWVGGVMGGRGSGELQVAIWKFSGKEKGCACLLQSPHQAKEHLSSPLPVVYTQIPSSFLFPMLNLLAVSSVLFLSPPLPLPPPLRWELTHLSLRMFPGDSPAVTVGDCDGKEELAKGFHKSVIQPEFWDIFIFSIIYSGHGIQKKVSASIFFSLLAHI